MTFLTLFGLQHPAHVIQTPVCIYAGYEHNDLRRAMQEASNDGLFDHYQMGNSAGYVIGAPLPKTDPIGPIGPIGPIPTPAAAAEPEAPARSRKK